MNDKVVLTCALNGVLTDPVEHHVPVSPLEMAAEARRAFDQGATVMHIHLRSQEPGRGHIGSWDATLSADVQSAIREACPGVIINHTTGVIGPHIEGALGCIRATKPEIAACNAGSLNYLKARADGRWAWKPMLFDNPVEKIQAFLDVMRDSNTRPEFECFDVGIVRSVGMFRGAGMYEGRLQYNFVMGVASGMPADPDLVPFLIKLSTTDATWSVTAIGRAEVWPLHRRAAELGGQLRTGLEDSFYLPDGRKATSNGQMIECLANVARECGRHVANAQEARELLGLQSSG